MEKRIFFLQYFEARYYDNNLGRFIEQDPVFWELGQTKRGIDTLADPQNLNSYGYARNNPVILTDPSGEYLKSSDATQEFKRYMDEGRGFSTIKKYYDSTTAKLFFVKSHQANGYYDLKRSDDFKQHNAANLKPD